MYPIGKVYHLMIALKLDVASSSGFAQKTPQLLRVSHIGSGDMAW